MFYLACKSQALPRGGVGHYADDNLEKTAEPMPVRVYWRKTKNQNEFLKIAHFCNFKKPAESMPVRVYGRETKNQNEFFEIGLRIVVQSGF